MVKDQYNNAPLLLKDELDLLKEILLFTATMSESRSVALAFSNESLPEQIYLITKFYLE